MNKVLVVQFRADKSLEHERLCFHEHLDGLVEVTFVNAISENDRLTKELLDDITHIIYGGSGECYMGRESKDSDWLHHVYDFTDEVLERKIPLFGICFGFQLIAMHAGAKIMAKPEFEELGAFEMKQTDEARSDSLFSHLTESYPANFAHVETVVDFPESIINYGDSSMVECEAYRIKDENVWAVMYHSELNRQQMIDRWNLYSDQGNDQYDNGNLDDVFANLEETEGALQVLKKFVQLKV